MSFNNGRKIGWWSAAAIVVANMLGTGVFSSLGLQLEEIQNTWSILLLWSLGGLIAVLGAFSYAELGTHLPKSGGEYHFLSKTIHPFIGYLSGWVSLTVGFSASIALAAMAMGIYTSKVFGIHSTYIALGGILLISTVHSFNIHQSSLFQNIFTSLKVLLILFLIISGLWVSTDADALNWDSSWKKEVFLPGYAVALVFVTYAYTGWNAAAYIVEEIRQPKRNLPIALIGGTLLVSILYVLLQLAFLSQGTLEDLQGEVDVGQIVGQNLFGEVGGKLVSFFIAFLLISSISAMVWIGPRVTRAMANDYSLWQFLGTDNKNGIPVRAIWFQALISCTLIATSTFEQVLLYSGFILQLFSTITIIGLFVLRARKMGHGGFKSPFFPLLQILYLAASAWILIYLIYDRPEESLSGIFNLFLGTLTYGINYWFFPSTSKKKSNESKSSITVDKPDEHPVHK